MPYSRYEEMLREGPAVRFRNELKERILSAGSEYYSGTEVCSTSALPPSLLKRILYGWLRWELSYEEQWAIFVENEVRAAGFNAMWLVPEEQPAGGGTYTLIACWGEGNGKIRFHKS
jgi:hypothetical protein